MKTIETKVETFADGSTIETDCETGNRTVCGKLAHDEYFKRLRAEQITAKTPYAIMDFCRDVDGTRKAELIRKVVTNPSTREMFGDYAWQVWTADDPKNVTCYMTEAKARAAFSAACLHGTNGFGIQRWIPYDTADMEKTAAQSLAKELEQSGKYSDIQLRPRKSEAGKQFVRIFVLC